jgi:hypothetical protein
MTGLSGRHFEKKSTKSKELSLLLGVEGT